MKLMNKKGIELSINFVIMLILAIAVFSLGISFVSKLFIKAEDVKLNLDKQSENELKSILSGGKQVAIFPSRLNIKKNNYQVSGIGIMNTLQAGPADDLFEIKVKFKSAFNADNNEITVFTGDHPDTWLTGSLGTGTQNVGIRSEETIKKNTKEELLVAIKVPRDADAGTFIFEVDINYKSGVNWIDYGPAERIYVIIK